MDSEKSTESSVATPNKCTQGEGVATKCDGDGEVVLDAVMCQGTGTHDKDVKPYEEIAKCVDGPCHQPGTEQGSDVPCQSEGTLSTTIYEAGKVDTTCQNGGTMPVCTTILHNGKDNVVDTICQNDGTINTMVYQTGREPGIDITCQSEVHIEQEVPSCHNAGLQDVTATCQRLKEVVRELQGKIDLERRKQEEFTRVTNQLYDQIRSIQEEKQSSEDSERRLISQIQSIQEDIITIEKLKTSGKQLDCSQTLSKYFDDQSVVDIRVVNSEAEPNCRDVSDEYIIEVENMDTSNNQESVLVQRIETATPDFQLHREKVIEAIGPEFRIKTDQPENPAVMDALEALLQLEQINRVGSPSSSAINQTISSIVSNECEVTAVDHSEVVNTMEVQTSSDFADSPSQEEEYRSEDLSMSSSCMSPSSVSATGDLPITSVQNLLQRKASRPTKSAFLPPCRVCSDPATGFHYGVNSCEACKGFFRRSIVKIQQKNQTYRCKRGPEKDGFCILGPGKRNSCAACRYKKCLATGMAVEAIKTGRYTYEKRTKDTVEVRKLLSKDADEEYMSSAELDGLLDVLRDVQLRNCPEAKLLLDEEFVKQRQQKAYNDYQAKIETFGSLSIVPQDVWNEFFNNTGIDLDNRLEFIKSRLERMELELTKMVDFVRSIPMFTELSVSDQTALIKSSHFEFWFLAAHKCINPSLRVVVGVRDFHEAEIKGIVRKDFTENLFSVAKSLLALNLTWEEITVVRGIVVTFTDRCDLEEPEKVERIQSRLISALRILAKRNKQDPDKRICKIVDRLTALRNMTELTHDIHKDILTWPLMKDYPLALDVLQGAS